MSDALSFLSEPDARALRSGPEPDAAAARLATVVEHAPALADPGLAPALVAVCGASRALAAVLLTLGDDAVPVVAAPGIVRPAVTGDTLAHDVGRHLLHVAALDLTGALPMPEVGSALSDLADAAARAALGDAPTPLAVIALGKWGGRELNYASDIDLVFVHEGDGAAAGKAAGEFLRRMTVRRGDGVAYRVDTDLRPEGAAGPLTRSVDSYRAYWERWAGVWELQAMMKARFVAGDEALGAAFLEAVDPFVFPDTLGGDAVREIRAMKARTERLVDDEEIKRGIGGIRDVEFAVQLLQLVHGRADRALRSANTLDGLRLLGEGGYVAAKDADEFAESYRWLRTVEHRLQLYDLRQTHTLPPDPATRERVAKAAGYRDAPGATALAAFEEGLGAHRARVRRIHEELFYRPLLEAFAEVPGETVDRIDRQLAAFGFTDSAAARTALAELTGGLSRRSRAMQQLLPVMLGWLSETPDPDLGLDQLRLLMASTDLMAPILRDTPSVAERLCLLLGSSRLAAKLINRIPPALPWLGDDAALASDAFALGGAVSRLAVREARPAQIETLHRFHAERLLHTAMADLSGFVDAVDVGHRLAATADAVVEAALAAAQAGTAGGDVPPMAVIAMGKWGGRELNYASDLDGLIVYRDDGEDADAAAAAVAESLVAMLSRGAVDLPVPVLDLDLRPEGKKGPLARSMASYRAYWSRWAQTWEHQALLRARPVAGDPSLGAEFAAAARAHAHPHRFDEDQVREVRAMKARIEKERIPVGEDPEFHMKLGRGGLADVEWVVQLLQMLHGDAVAEIRTASTVDGLRRLAGAGLLSTEDAAVLDAAYRFCAAVRNRLYLRAGRIRDSLPTDPEEAARLAVSLGYEINPRSALREEYRRVTRRARRVVDRVFYGR